MSLPSLDRLALAPTGVDREEGALEQLRRAMAADREQALWDQGIGTPPPQAPRQEEQARPVERPIPVIQQLDPQHAWAYGPRLVCLQDQNGESLSAARVVYDFLHRYRERSDGWNVQFDDPAEEQRYNNALALGQTPPSPPKEFLPWLLAWTVNPLRLVKTRLSRVLGTICRELHALTYFGPANDRYNNLGFTVTLTERYGEADNYQFHTDMHEDGVRRFLPEGVYDWHMLTMVYYLVPPDSEARAADRPGQGSTLLNMNNTQMQGSSTNYWNTQPHVAYCPLQNGAISVFDGSRWHAVGMNYDVARGAVTLKAVIYKPNSATREWSHEEWWSRVDSVLRDLGSGPSARESEFRLAEHREALLNQAMQRPEGYVGM